MKEKYHWYQCSASQCQVLLLASYEDALHTSGLFLQVVPYIREEIWHFSTTLYAFCTLGPLCLFFIPPAYECLCLVGWIFGFHGVALCLILLFFFDVWSSDSVWGLGQRNEPISWTSGITWGKKSFSLSLWSVKWCWADILFVWTKLTWNRLGCIYTMWLRGSCSAFLAAPGTPVLRREVNASLQCVMAVLNASYRENSQGVASGP